MIDTTNHFADKTHVHFISFYNYMIIIYLTYLTIDQYLRAASYYVASPFKSS